MEIIQPLLNLFVGILLILFPSVFGSKLKLLEVAATDEQGGKNKASRYHRSANIFSHSSKHRLNIIENLQTQERHIFNIRKKFPS